MTHAISDETTSIGELKSVETRGTAGRVSGASTWLFNIGFLTALVLAAFCFGSSWWYLDRFLASNNQAIQELIDQGMSQKVHEGTLVFAMNARMVMGRFALISCGISVGMSFGFLGFALFLLGIKGDMDVEAEHETFTVKVARLSPGLAVIICATVLIVICVKRETPFRYQSGGATGAPQMTTSELEKPRPERDLFGKREPP